MNFMREHRQRGMTLLVVTHEIAFAHAASDRVVFMDGGVVVEEGSAADMFERPREARTKRFLARVGQRSRTMPADSGLLFTFFNVAVAQQYLPAILEGTLVTVGVGIAVVITGTLLGL